jgi:TRAP-type C4-dicarboxylate transport system substrate-binding protein
MKKCIHYLLLTFFIFAFCLVPLANAADPITLKASSFLPKNHPIAVKAHAWIDLINKQMKDSVKVKYVGGPEVIPALEQIESVRKGITDISFTAGAHYGTQLAAANSFHLSRLMPWKERKSGYFDLMDKEHQKIGVKYIGRWFYGPFYMWLKKPAKTSAELRGRRLRTHPIYDRFYKAIGISSVTVQTSEIFTALERGVIEGTSWPIQGPRERGWTKFLKYIVNHPFYDKNNTVIVMNLNTWKKLPEGVKSKLNKLTESFERDMIAYFQKQIQTESDLVLKKGVKSIVFPPDDAKKFVGAAYSAEWADLEKKIPDLVPMLKKTSGN